MFHVLVTLGTGAVGCDGDSMGSSSPPEGAGGKHDGAVVTCPNPTDTLRRDAAADIGLDAAVPDCEHTEQLSCARYVPSPQGCICDPNAPLSAADCSEGRFKCDAYDPPMGCNCVSITGPR